MGNIKIVTADDDSVLVSELKKGNRDIYKHLFMKYYSPLCEYAAYYIPNSDAEDLVQNFMLQLWETRELLSIDTSLKSYLFKSVKNKCLNAIRDREVRENIHNFLQKKLSDQLENPNFYLLNELTEEIKKAVDALPENYKEVFNMSRFGDKKNTEIAEKLGISVKTVEYRITQSLKILRVKLKDYLYVLLL